MLITLASQTLLQFLGKNKSEDLTLTDKIKNQLDTELNKLFLFPELKTAIDDFSQYPDWPDVYLLNGLFVDNGQYRCDVRAVALRTLVNSLHLDQHTAPAWTLTLTLGLGLDETNQSDILKSKLNVIRQFDKFTSENMAALLAKFADILDFSDMDFPQFAGALTGYDSIPAYIVSAVKNFGRKNKKIQSVSIADRVKPFLKSGYEWTSENDRDLDALKIYLLSITSNSYLIERINNYLNTIDLIETARDCLRVAISDQINGVYNKVSDSLVIIKNSFIETEHYSEEYSDEEEINIVTKTPDYKKYELFINSIDEDKCWYHWLFGEKTKSNSTIINLDFEKDVSDYIKCDTGFMFFQHTENDFIRVLVNINELVNLSSDDSLWPAAELVVDQTERGARLVYNELKIGEIVND